MSELRRRSFVGAGAAGLVVAAAPANAQERVKSGTVDIEQVQVAFIGSGNLGGGTLHFQGKSYRFTVGGLGIGGFGVSKMQASGEVYNLRELAHFPGAATRVIDGSDHGISDFAQYMDEVLVFCGVPADLLAAHPFDGNASA